MTTKEKHDQRLQELELLEEKRLKAHQQIKLYQVCFSMAFNKKIKQWIMKEGDLVVIAKRPMIMTHNQRKIPP